MKNVRKNPGSPALGVVKTHRRNDHAGAVGDHPGKVDRMVGNRKDGASGPSHPDYLPRKRGRK